MNKRLTLVILGMPGSGKGTQAEKLVAKFHFNYIATGSLVRKKAKIDETIRQRMISGQPQPDSVVISAVRQALSEIDLDKGILFDAFPLSLDQAQALEQMTANFKLTQPIVLYIKILPETVIKRLSLRFVCPKCKDIFKPGSNGYDSKKCPLCLEKLIQRDDDKPEAVQRRISENQERMDVLEKYFTDNGQIIIINGEPPVEEVTKEIFAKLESYL
jgi:adenylate kinase